MIRKTTMVLLAAFTLMVATVTPVLAADPLNDACGGVGGVTESTTCTGRSSVNNPAITVIVDVIQILLTIIGVAAVIVIIIAGFRYVTSSGDPNTINSAKNTILFAVVGLIVALSAQLIIAFVINKL